MTWSLSIGLGILIFMFLIRLVATLPLRTPLPMVPVRPLRTRLFVPEALAGILYPLSRVFVAANRFIPVAALFRLTLNVHLPTPTHFPPVVARLLAPLLPLPQYTYP